MAHIVLNLPIDAIMSSGDGISEKSAFYVIYVSILIFVLSLAGGIF